MLPSNRSLLTSGLTRSSTLPIHPLEQRRLHGTESRRKRAIPLLLPLAFFSVVAFSAAQQQPPAPSISAASQPSPENSASISGTVLDVSGASITGAGITLSDERGAPQQKLVSGAHGEFTFSQIPPGSYFVLITDEGLQSFHSEKIVVAAQQSFQLPNLVLSVAQKTTEVTVRPTEVIAAEQLKAEEQQRILGFIPGFYTSYNFGAVPLTAKQKYSLAFHDVFDPVRFAASAAVAGVEQARNSYAGYGQGAAGYGKRFAATYGDGLTGDLLSHAVFPSLLHQDPRYFYQGSGTRKSRLLHAISFAVVVRGDNGHQVPNYSYLLGDLGSGLLSNLYYPHADRGVGLVFINVATGVGGRAAGSIIREFLLPHITRNVHPVPKP